MDAFILVLPPRGDHWMISGSCCGVYTCGTGGSGAVLRRKRNMLAYSRSNVVMPLVSGTDTEAQTLPVAVLLLHDKCDIGRLERRKREITHLN